PASPRLPWVGCIASSRGSTQLSHLCDREGRVRRAVRGGIVRGIVIPLVTAITLVVAGAASAAGWTSSVPFANVVASSPTSGGGYPDDATGAPSAGTCGPGSFNANHSESWLAVQPGTENIVGASKFFFGPWSTFYNFYLGSYAIPNGTPAGNNQVQGYDCVSTGTQAMPPSWTNSTD